MIDGLALGANKGVDLGVAAHAVAGRDFGPAIGLERVLRHNLPGHFDPFAHRPAVFLSGEEVRQDGGIGLGVGAT